MHIHTYKQITDTHKNEINKSKSIQKQKLRNKGKEITQMKKEQTGGRTITGYHHLTLSVNEVIIPLRGETFPGCYRTGSKTQLCWF